MLARYTHPRAEELAQLLDSEGVCPLCGQVRPARDANGRSPRERLSGVDRGEVA
jgi:hypothetical protein